MARQLSSTSETDREETRVQYWSVARRPAEFHREHVACTRRRILARAGPVLTVDRQRNVHWRRRTPDGRPD